MAKVKKESPSEKNTSVLENSDSLANRIVGTSEVLKKNFRVLSIAASVVAVLIISYLIYLYISSEQEREAQTEMFASVYYFEADSLNKALKGDGNYKGFLAIIEDYPLSKASNLARFYAGTAYLKKGEFQKAIEHLQKFSSSDLLVQARAYSLIGDAYLELKKTDDAITYYKKAVDYKPNKFFTPNYLMKLGLAYELKNDKAAALQQYERVQKEFFDAPEAVNAKKYKAKLEAELGK